MPVLKTAARKGYEVMVWGMAISPCVVFHPADLQVLVDQFYFIQDLVGRIRGRKINAPVTHCSHDSGLPSFFFMRDVNRHQKAPKAVLLCLSLGLAQIPPCVYLL